MKNPSRLWLAGLTAGWLFTHAAHAVAQDQSTPATSSDQPVDEDAARQARLRAAIAQVNGGQGAATTTTTTTTPVVEAPAVPLIDSTNAGTVVGTADSGLRLNLRGVSVDTALKYLSEAAGFTIIRQADTRSGGTIDVVSDKTLNKEEVVNLLNKVIADNGLAANLDGKTLTIMTIQQSLTNNKTPVHKFEGELAAIPQDNVVVTEVITMHSLNPTQVVRDLGRLIPNDADVKANEGGNAIVITARRNDIHHFVEIIQALDSSTIGDLQVFMLNYADSKAIAQELKDVFTTDSTAGNPFANFFGRGRGGGGGFPGFGGGGGGDQGSADAKRAPVKVNAVADDQNNAVIVSAPVDYMPGISNLIVKLDIPQDDVIQIKVFGLRNADPTDVVTELSSLFPDPNAQNNGAARGRGAQFGGAFGGGFGGFGRGGGASASTTSDRMKKQTTVLAVADARTQSVIVTAAKDTMVEIEAMIDKLDGNPARHQQVYSFYPMNASVSDIQNAMTDLFMQQGRTSSTQNRVDPLTQRQTQAAQQQTTSSTFGSSSGGGGGGGLGAGGR